jgi:hypothetical protein
VKDRDHWLASPKREEFFGPLGCHQHPDASSTHRTPFALGC